MALVVDMWGPCDTSRGQSHVPSCVAAVAMAAGIAPHSLPPAQPNTLLLLRCWSQPSAALTEEEKPAQTHV